MSKSITIGEWAILLCVGCLTLGVLVVVWHAIVGILGPIVSIALCVFIVVMLRK